MAERDILKGILNDPNTLRGIGFTDQEIQAGVNPASLPFNDPRRMALKHAIIPLTKQAQQPQVQQVPQQVPLRAPQGPSGVPFGRQLPTQAPQLPPQARPQTPQIQPQISPNSNRQSSLRPSLLPSGIPTPPKSSKAQKTSGLNGRARQTIFNKNKSGSNIPGSSNLLASEVFKTKTPITGQYAPKKPGKLIDQEPQYGFEPWLTPVGGWPTNPNPAKYDVDPTASRVPTTKSYASNAPVDGRGGATWDAVKSFFGKVKDAVQVQPISFLQPQQTVNQSVAPVSTTTTQTVQPKTQQTTQPTVIKKIQPISTTSTQSTLLQPANFTPIPEAELKAYVPKTTTPITTAPVLSPQVTTSTGSIIQSTSAIKPTKELTNVNIDDMVKSYFDADLGADAYAYKALEAEGIQAPWQISTPLRQQLRKEYGIDEKEIGLKEKQFSLEKLPQKLENEINDKDQWVTNIEAQQDAIYKELWKLQDNPDPANIGRESFLKKQLVSLQRVRREKIQSYDRIFSKIVNAAQAEYNNALNEYKLAFENYKQAYEDSKSDSEKYWEASFNLKKSVYDSLGKAEEAVRLEEKTKQEKIKTILDYATKGYKVETDADYNITKLSYTDEDGATHVVYESPINVVPVAGEEQTAGTAGPMTINPVKVVNEKGDVIRDYEAVKRAIETGEGPYSAKNEGGASLLRRDPGLNWYAKQLSLWDQAAIEEASKAGGTLPEGALIGPSGELLKKNNNMVKIDQLKSQGLSKDEVISSLKGGLFNVLNGDEQWYIDHLYGGSITASPQTVSSAQSNKNLTSLPLYEVTKLWADGIVTGYGSKLWQAGLDYVIKTASGKAKGAPVPSPINGTVVAVASGYSNPNMTPLPASDGKTQNSGFGNQVKIKLDNGYEMWISHLDAIANNLTVGTRIAKGVLLGTQGNTGSTYGNTGVHLDVTMVDPQGRLVPAEVTHKFIQSVV